MSLGLLTGFPKSASSSSLPGLNDKLHAMSEALSRNTLGRQRLFAAHSHETQQLQQMVSLLTSRANTRVRGGISDAGLMEECQLYALCMQELGVQLAVHSPALSETSGQLYTGFVQLFRRSVQQQEARLSKERDAHQLTRMALSDADSETNFCRSQVRLSRIREHLSRI